MASMQMGVWAHFQTSVHQPRFPSLVSYQKIISLPHPLLPAVFSWLLCPTTCTKAQHKRPTGILAEECYSKSVASLIRRSFLGPTYQKILLSISTTFDWDNGNSLLPGHSPEILRLWYLEESSCSKAARCTVWSEICIPHSSRNWVLAPR